MAAIVILAFLVLIAPLAYVYGADSRRIADRGWMAAPRRATRPLDGDGIR